MKEIIMVQGTKVKCFMDEAEIPQNSGKYLLWFLMAVFLLFFITSGCISPLLPGAKKRKWEVFQQKVSAIYEQTVLQQSLSLDVIPELRQPLSDLGQYSGLNMFIQNQNVATCLYQSQDSYVTWFNMFAFDTNRLHVVRKYFFIVNDKPAVFSTATNEGLRFDCEMVLPSEVLSREATTENARLVAFLRYMLAVFRQDIDTLGSGEDSQYQSSHMLDICGMMINQAIESVLIRIDASPALATRLEYGVEFSHINFDKGIIQMLVNDMSGYATMKIRLGSFMPEITDI